MALPNDFIEIDFLAVETGKSGDAIAIQYAIGGMPYIHVVDGGFTDMGETIVAHLDNYYSSQRYIDHVVLTHPDGDHARGLKYVLENRQVNNLWMNRPWLYTDELIDRFRGYNSSEYLRRKLKDCYPNVAALEDIALEQGIPIHEVFQGQAIGAFTVMSPSRARFLNLVVNSDKTPEAAVTTAEALIGQLAKLTEIFKAAANLVKAAWGEETFPSGGTSSENEMSVIQFANFGNLKFLLTGDAGREALKEAADYAPWIGLTLPGIDRFQVPHHGSRRNVSTELLDRWLGERLDGPTGENNEKFSATISSAAADLDHPRKAVERALHHRGAKVMATEGTGIRTGWNAPAREGWVALSTRPYPSEQEE